MNNEAELQLHNQQKIRDMRRIVILLGCLLCCTLLNAQSMKMVVDNNGDVVGRYVRTNETTYTVDVQDTYDVPKAGNHVVTFKASAGQGIVYRNQMRKGNINVRKGPSLKHAVIAKIVENDGVPDTYPCLGKVNGWYKIRINGKTGFVRADLMKWDGMCSF